jgi:hypothetical protein
MKTQLKYFPFCLLVCSLMMFPVAASAQTPGDGDCPVCFADIDDLGNEWCDAWLMGYGWCASAYGVCVSGGDFCEPQVALLTIDGADFTEHQVDWSGFPSLDGIGEKLATSGADGWAHLLSCRGTVRIRAYTPEIQSSLRTDVNGLAL